MGSAGLAAGGNKVTNVARGGKIWPGGWGMEVVAILFVIVCNCGCFCYCSSWLLLLL